MGFLPDADNCVLWIHSRRIGNPHFNVSDKMSMYINAIHIDYSTHKIPGIRKQYTRSYKTIIVIVYIGMAPVRL